VAYSDKSLVCQDCGITFTFTASEQELFAQKGYQNEPKRCPDCRRYRRNNQSAGSIGAQRGSSFSSEPRQLFTTTCASCGGEARVPFQPRNNKPVYCSACFSKMGTRA
jgi:CxxC-x17-CxxC domain-containing protein